MSDFNQNYPYLSKIIAAFDESWPEHRAILEKGIISAEPHVVAHANRLAELFDPVMKDHLNSLVADYQWLCKMFVNEQMHFYRTGNYRLSKIEDAIREVYSDQEFMTPYMNGLLVTQFVWTNHTQANEMFVSKFLPMISDKKNLMEVGPGHGMFLSMAALEAPNAELHAWDISDTSLDATVSTLKRLGITKHIETKACDLVASDFEKDRFDAVVCSEVLEHTDQPEKALQNLTDALKVDGKMFLNVPVNSPAPDHLTLWRHPDEVQGYYTSTGLKMEAFNCFPGTGLTLERALKQNADITCVGIMSKTS